MKLEGYTYSNFQINIDDSKSIIGYVFTLNGGIISYNSFK